MNLNIDEIERYLCTIFTGSSICYIDNGSEEICITFKHPDNFVRLKANDVYDKAYKDAIEEGILPLKELEELIRERNIFTQADEDKISSLKSQLKAQQVLLSKTTVVKANVERIEKIIELLKQQILELEHKKYSKLAMSAETKAEEERTSYFCWACTFVDDKLYWKEYKDFLNEINLVFRSSVLTKFIKFHGGIDTKIVRYIARSNLWRIRYVTSQKVSDQLFGLPTSQYTNDMLNLAYWSNFYQNIYEMLPEDRPSDLIIEDDEALDAYMKHYYEERNREDAARRSKNKSKGKLSAFDSEEVIVTQSSELYEDIEYDKPREARMMKDRTDFKKKPKSKRRVGQVPDWVHKK